MWKGRGVAGWSWAGGSWSLCGWASGGHLPLWMFLRRSVLKRMGQWWTGVKEKSPSAYCDLRNLAVQQRVTEEAFPDHQCPVTTMRTNPQARASVHTLGVAQAVPRLPTPSVSQM